jgi:hypothetical protein
MAMGVMGEGGVVERVWLGSADDVHEAYDVAETYALIMRALGISPDAWRVGVRTIRQDFHAIEAVRQQS